MKAAFVLVVHPPEDERVWFQQAQSLKDADIEVSVISTVVSKSDLPDTYCFDASKIAKKELIRKLRSILSEIKPDVIICDNPIAILVAKEYNKRAEKKAETFYDITEWYPSKKNLREFSFVKRIVKTVLLSLLSYYSAWLIDGFIFGESDKAKPFRFLFPWKKFIFLPYYSDTESIKTYPVNEALSKRCTLFYSGNLTEEKGFFNVLNAASVSAAAFPDTQFVLSLISYNELPQSIIKEYTSDNLEITKKPFLSFPDFCNEIGKADIFLDLRKIDIENTRCLPIKIFYYLAAGRPVIYSDLKAIRKGIPEIDDVGILVDPRNTQAIKDQVGLYLKNESYYQQQCIRARELAVSKYNWKNIEFQFVQFIKSGKG